MQSDNTLPTEDGIDVIHVMSSGQTMLGQMLHTSAYCPIVHPVYGYFVSLRGYHAWLATGCRHEVYRVLYGTDINRVVYTHRDQIVSPLASDLCAAVNLKLEQNLTLRHMFTCCTLPLKFFDDVNINLPGLMVIDERIMHRHLNDLYTAR